MLNQLKEVQERTEDKIYQVDKMDQEGSAAITTRWISDSDIIVNEDHRDQENSSSFTTRWINETKGYGTFTTRTFSKGDFLLEYRGEMMSYVEATKEEATYSVSNDSDMYYFKHSGKKMCFDVNSRTGLGQMVNNAPKDTVQCNSRLQEVEVGGKRKRCLFAARDIKAEEEICLDYSSGDFSSSGEGFANEDEACKYLENLWSVENGVQVSDIEEIQHNNNDTTLDELISTYDGENTADPELFAEADENKDDDDDDNDWVPSSSQKPESVPEADENDDDDEDDNDDEDDDSDDSDWVPPPSSQKDVSAEEKEEDGDTSSGSLKTLNDKPPAVGYLRPRRSCPFCSKSLTDSRLKRHIKGVHGSEEEVKNALKQPKGTQRRLFFDMMKRGIFKEIENHLGKDPDVMPRVRRVFSVVICSTCKGTYSKNSFRMHKKDCKYLSEGQIAGVVDPSLSLPHDQDSDFTSSILSKMKQDDIGRLAAEDPFIVKIGKCLWHNRQGMKSAEVKTREAVARQMRQLAAVFSKFKEQLKIGRNDVSNLNLSGMFSPEHFTVLVACVSKMTSCHSRLDHIVKRNIRVLLTRSTAILRSDFLINKNEIRAKEVEKFELLFKSREEAIFGENKDTRQSVLNGLPMYSYIKRILEYSTKVLGGSEIEEEWTSTHFEKIRDAVLSRLTLLNAKTSGDPCCLSLQEWQDALRATDGDDGHFLRVLDIEGIADPLDRQLLRNMRVVDQSNRGGPSVPVLVPEDCMRAMAKFADTKVRRNCKVSRLNRFLFPLIGNRSVDCRDKWQCLKTVSNAAQVNQPTNLSEFEIRCYARMVYRMITGDEDESGEVLESMEHSSVVSNQEGEIEPGESALIATESLDNTYDEPPAVGYLRPRRSCPFCSKSLIGSRLKQHIKGVHGSEEEVKHALKQPKATQRRLFLDMMKRGIFKEIKNHLGKDPDEMPRLRRSLSSMVICSNCKGTYSRHGFHRHKKECEDVNRGHLAGIINPFLLSPHFRASEFRSTILPALRKDGIGRIAAEDPFIVKVAQCLWLEKQKKNFAGIDTRGPLCKRMRLLATLLSNFKERLQIDGTDVSNINASDMFSTEHFAALVASISKMTSHADKQLYSMKNMIRLLIEKCAKLLRADFIVSNDELRAKGVERFQVLFMNKKRSIFGDAEDMFRKWRATRADRRQLPLDSDIKKLWDYSVNLLREKLKIEEEWRFSHFVAVRNVVVARLTLVNVQMSSTPSGISLQEWQDAVTAAGSDGCQLPAADREALTDLLHHQLLKGMRVINQSGNGPDGMVPVLVPEDCVEALSMMADIKLRRNCGIARSNGYLFPLLMGSLGYANGWDCVRKVAKAAQVDRLDALTKRENHHHVGMAYVMCHVAVEESGELIDQAGESSNINNQGDEAQPSLTVTETVEAACGGTSQKESKDSYAGVSQKSNAGGVRKSCYKKRPRRSCPFCEKLLADSRLKRHLTSVHKGEQEVKHAMEQPKALKKQLFHKMLKRGLYNEIMKVGIDSADKPLLRRGVLTSTVICSSCKGPYSRKTFSHHRLRCPDSSIELFTGKAPVKYRRKRHDAGKKSKKKKSTNSDDVTAPRRILPRRRTRCTEKKDKPEEGTDGNIDDPENQDNPLEEGEQDTDRDDDDYFPDPAKKEKRARKRNKWSTNTTELIQSHFKSYIYTEGTGSCGKLPDWEEMSNFLHEHKDVLCSVKSHSRKIFLLKTKVFNERKTYRLKLNKAKES